MYIFVIVTIKGQFSLNLYNCRSGRFDYIWNTREYDTGLMLIISCPIQNGDDLNVKRKWQYGD